MKGSPISPAAPDGRYELRFVNLFDPGRGYAFPCDAHGRVQVGQLSERGRSSYLQARGRVGLELMPPVVVVAD